MFLFFSQKDVPTDLTEDDIGQTNSSLHQKKVCSTKCKEGIIIYLIYSITGPGVCYKCHMAAKTVFSQLYCGK